jgi:hypothetical protein
MIRDINLPDGDQVTVIHYEGDPVKLMMFSNSGSECCMLENNVRELVNTLICTLPEARQFIHEDRYGREWKAKTMGLKKEELVDQLQKAKQENLWLIDQVRMRAVNEWSVETQTTEPKKGICTACDGSGMVTLEFDFIHGPCPYCKGGGSE